MADAALALEPARKRHNVDPWRCDCGRMFGGLTGFDAHLRGPYRADEDGSQPSRHHEPQAPYVKDEDGVWVKPFSMAAEVARKPQDARKRAA